MGGMRGRYGLNALYLCMKLQRINTKNEKGKKELTDDSLNLFREFQPMLCYVMLNCVTPYSKILP